MLFGDGDTALLGRDPDRCQVVAWEAQRKPVPTMSRVAAELWCSDGEMWVRNLSGTHELVVTDAVGRESKLFAQDPDAPGHARNVHPGWSLSFPSAGSWQVRIQRFGAPSGAMLEDMPDDEPDREPVKPPGRFEAAGPLPDLPSIEPGQDGREPPEAERWTVSVAPVPDGHRAVATALCAPLVAGADRPATYAEVGAALGIKTENARRLCVRLVEWYAPQVELLHPDGPLPDDTLSAAVARLLVDRRRVPVPAPDSPGMHPVKDRSLFARRRRR